MDYNTVRSMIDSTNGHVFGASFVKKSGEVRTMNCRIGVTSKLRGGKSTTAHKQNLVTVYDMNAKDYRCINIDTLKSLNIAGRHYEIS